tara:strand:- start:157 stop:324 length:168 start_codon:yes stop_codon:yes gene_type:complete
VLRLQCQVIELQRTLVADFAAAVAKADMHHGPAAVELLQHHTQQAGIAVQQAQVA